MHMLVVEFRQVMCLLTFSSEASNSRTGLVTRTKLLQHNPLKHRLITIRDSTISNLMSGLSPARSFYQALRHDPNLAMAYIGLSRVYSGLDNPAAARKFFEKAKALASKVSDRERRRIEIREKQLEAMQDLEDAAKPLHRRASFRGFSKSVR